MRRLAPALAVLAIALAACSQPAGSAGSLLPALPVGINVLESTVGGNVQLEQNPGAVEVSFATVGGDVRLEANPGGLEVFDDAIDGNLQCSSNAMALDGGGIVVGGDQEGQCAAF
jgi:hypothetical protein